MSTPRSVKNVLFSGIAVFATVAVYNRGTEPAGERFHRSSRFGGFNPGTHNMVWKTHDFNPLADVQAHYHNQAHTLTRADDFFPHFKAVLELPGMTLNQTKLGCDWGDDYIKCNFQYTDNEDWVKQDRPNEEI